MSKIKGILVDVQNGIVKPVEVEDELTDYYRVLNCDTIDIITVKLGDEYVTVVCDDEALLKPNARESAIDTNGRAMLHGNLFFCYEDDFEMTDLPANLEDYLISHTTNVELLNGERWKAVYGIRY